MIIGWIKFKIIAGNTVAPVSQTIKGVHCRPL